MNAAMRRPSSALVGLALCAAAACAAAACALAAPPAEVPVMIGEVADMDACMAWGEVRGLKTHGDGFLAVRAGPGTDHAIRDRVREGQGLHLCGASPDGTWWAVVYAPAGRADASDCGVGAPLPRPVAYRGPCAWGWVNARWVALIAG